jgi:branched-chain amino acid transport system substrate-binding protein
MRRITTLVLITALGAGLLSACGSSSNSGTSASAAGNPTAQSGPTGPGGKPIVLGSICSCSGPEASSVGAVAKTLQGWAAWTNARGGINGHPVKLTVLDDGGNATTSLQDAKQLVEGDHAIAIVGELSLVDVAWANYVKQQGVPVIGAALFNSTFLTNPDFFPTGAQVPTLVYGLVDQARKVGKTKVGVMACAEAPACAQFAPLIAGLGAKVVGGVSVPYNSKITVTQPSYTANCLSAQNANAEAQVVVENAATVVRVADQCAQQGYKPLQLNLSGTVGQAWASDANLDGAIGIEPNPVLADQSIPATKEFHQALSRYAPDVTSSADYNEVDSWVWSAAQAFALAAKRANIGPDSTPTDVTKGLLTFKNETVGGLTPPLTYKPGAPGLVGCYYVTQVKGGKFIAPGGATPNCLPATAANAMAAILKGGSA